jgi:hypothetical protein
MQRGKTITVDGALVCWDLGASALGSVTQAFLNRSLDHWAPKVRSDAECLRAALIDVGLTLAVDSPDPASPSTPPKRRGRGSPRERLIQRLRTKEAGLEVVRVDRGDTANQYVGNYSARVEGGVVKTVYGDAPTAALQESYDYHKTIVTPGGMGGGLIALIKERYKGLTYGRGAGGTYWVEAQWIEEFEGLATDLETCCITDRGSTVSINEVALTPRTARDLIKSLTDEIISETDGILDEVLDMTLGERALENRKERTLQLDADIQHWEELLQTSLDGLHAAVERTRQAAAVAIMRQMSAPTVALNTAADGDRQQMLPGFGGIDFGEP